MNRRLYITYLILVFILGCKKKDLTPPPPPLAPSDVTASIIDYKSITVQWKDNADNEIGYIVNRTIKNVSTKFNLPPNTTTFKDSIAYPDQAYFYSVAATTGTVLSAFIQADSWNTSGFVALKTPSLSEIKVIANTPDSLLLSCTLDNPNDTSAITGFYWIDQASSNFSLFSTTINDGITSNPGMKASQLFTVSIPVKPNSKYSIRAYAKNRALFSQKEIIITSPAKGLANISSNLGFINYGSSNTTVVLDTILNDGYSTISARGIVWSLSSPNPTLPSNSIPTSTLRSKVNILLPSFPAASKIYIREYATNAFGTAYGPQAILKTATPLSNISIGDYYDGGIIFYLLKPSDPGYDPLVKHGLIAAIPKVKNLTPTSFWGSYIPTNIGTDTALFTGALNTQKIINLPNSNEFDPVQFVKNTSYWPTGDWFLPSKNEMSIFYNFMNIDSYYIDLLRYNIYPHKDYIQVALSSSEVAGNPSNIWAFGFGYPYTVLSIKKSELFINYSAIPVKQF